MTTIPSAAESGHDAFFRKLYDKSTVFLLIFLEQSGIHGFAYLAKVYLSRLERFIWSILIIVSFYCCFLLSQESWKHYQTKSTVVSIEKDHYYWNTSLPSLTICPMKRLHPPLFDAYCSKIGLTGTNKSELWDFLESLANSSYMNFEDIQGSESVDRLYIKPEDYMMLIYNLTEDMVRRDNPERRVRTVNNLEFIKTTQILTEYGICYATNNFIANNMSTKYLFEGIPAEQELPQYPNLQYVKFGNLFDGDITFSFIGFSESIAIFLHSPYEMMNIAKTAPATYNTYEFESYSVEIIASNNFLSDTTILQRGCRFHSESNLTHFEIYTKGICLQECRLNLAFQHCGCIPHFYPNRGRYRKKVCHYKTLQTCFPKIKELLLEFHSYDKDGNVENFHCDCVQNCVDSNVFVEKMRVLKGTIELLGSIGGMVVTRKFPLIRYRRQILFTFTDLLVSIGGSAGLLLGFSVLGAVEIVYFFTVRLFWYILGHR